jgi:hypothetical protein
MANQESEYMVFFRKISKSPSDLELLISETLLELESFLRIDEIQLRRVKAVVSVFSVLHMSGKFPRTVDDMEESVRLVMGFLGRYRAERMGGGERLQAIRWIVLGLAQVVIAENGREVNELLVEVSAVLGDKYVKSLESYRVHVAQQRQ